MKKRKFTISWQKRSAKRSYLLQCSEKELWQEAATWDELDLHIPEYDLPRIDNTKVTKTQLLDIYAATCLYEYKIRGGELQELLGDLIGSKALSRQPRIVEKFITGAQDQFTLEVKRAAERNKESLLGRVGAACQRYTPSQSTSVVSLRPLRAEESTQSRPSSSVSAP